jgi:predicted transcriptional regulator
MTAGKASTQDAVVGALTADGDRTVAEIAKTVGLGRSTVGKALARLEQSGRVRRSARGRDGARRLADRWSIAKSKAARRPTPASERLRPGELDGLVLKYIEAHQAEGPLGPAAVAKALSRSSGAVSNCLSRLAAAGRVRQVRDRPRRYTLA